MTLDPTYQGAVMQGGGALYSLRADGNFAGASLQYDGANVVHTVVLTGYKQTSLRGNVHYQTTSGYWIFIPDGWQQIGIQSVKQYSQSQAQALVDRIMSNNATILCNNLLCARYANKLTSDQQARVRELQRRLNGRNEALKQEGLVQVTKTQYPEGFVDFAPYLEKLMAGESIGVAISTWVAIIVGCIVLAGMGTAAYFTYKALADESEADVKFSKELTSILVSKLTPEEYEQLKKETQGLVTKGKIKTLIRSNAKWLTIAAIAVGGYWAYKKFLQ